jgi:hypothetical protein
MRTALPSVGGCRRSRDQGWSDLVSVPTRNTSPNRGPPPTCAREHYRGRKDHLAGSCLTSRRSSGECESADATRGIATETVKPESRPKPKR